MRPYGILLFLLALLTSPAVFAADQELFSKATATYQAGNLDRAEHDYRELLVQNEHDPALLHNLGQIYRSQQRDGRARASFLKALKYDPRHGPSRQALSEMGYETPWGLRRNEVWAGLLLANALAALALFKGRRTLAAVALVSALTCGAWLLPRPPQAVVISDQAPVRVGAQTDAPVVSRAALASTWTVRDRSDRWVRLDGQEGSGWVQAEMVEVI